jgi:signal transduction histidine kinase
VEQTPKILADAEKISVVVNNLLGNAVKYAHNEGKIVCKVGPATGGAQISVKDSGIGILPNDLKKVFEKFYQANNADRMCFSGNGVGLALVKAYTEGHGGRVHVESTVEKGSTFVIELPAAPQEDGAS